MMEPLKSPPAVLFRLALARRYLERARAEVSLGSPFAAATAVVAGQDAVELVLWALGTYSGSLGGAPPKMNFNNLVNGVPTASKHKPRFMALNDLRVQAKHHGTTPSTSAASELLEYAAEALEEITIEEPPHLRLSTVTLTSDLRNRLVATLIDEASALVDASETSAFLMALGKADLFLRKHARALPSFTREFFSGPSADRNRVNERLRAEVRKAFDEVGDELQRLHLYRRKADEVLLREVLPPITVAQSGKTYAFVERVPPTLPPWIRRRVLLAVLAAAEDVDEAERVRAIIPKPGTVQAQRSEEVTIEIGGDVIELGEIVAGCHYRGILQTSEIVSVLLYGHWVDVPRTMFME